MKFYVEKMQTTLYVDSAIKMLKIYGSDYFTEINIRNNNLDIIEKDIAVKNLLGDSRTKATCNYIRKVAKTKNIIVEFIKK